MLSRGKRMMLLAKIANQPGTQINLKVSELDQQAAKMKVSHLDQRSAKMKVSELDHCSVNYDQEEMRECLKLNIANSEQAQTPFCASWFTPLEHGESSSSCVNGERVTESQLERLKNVYLPRDAHDISMSDYDDSDADPNFVPSSSDVESDKDSMARQIEANIELDQHVPSTSKSVFGPNLGSVTIITNSQVNISNMADITGEVDANSETLNRNIQSSSTSAIRQNIKKCRNSGMRYTTSSQKIIKARECTPLQACRFNCKNKVSFEQQNEIFKKYWSLGNYKQRICYLAGLIQINPIKRTTVIKTSKSKVRLNSYTYHVEINGIHTKLCQKCFRKTLGETDNFIKSVAKKKLEKGNLNEYLADRRGKTVPPNKLDANKIQEIKAHITSFPAYESHYTRAHTSQLYLESDLTLTKMHQLYSTSHSKPVSISKYSEIFKEMGIKFRKPKLDTCNKCEILKVQIEGALDETEKIRLMDEQQKHHESATQAYNAKNVDKETAVLSTTTKVFTFDLQQCLPTPFLKTSVSFYKRPLWTYNLTIHDCVTNNAFCYMWHEGIGGRGGNDIASCVFEHLRSIPETIKSITCYSDSCAGQNKNSYIAAMFSVLIKNSHLDEINHKFLIPGHTHMECDSDHAIIEKKKKKTNMKIHHPRDWFNFISSVGNKRNFSVIEMENKFLNFSSVSKSKFTFRKTDINGNKFYWKDVKWMRYTRQFGRIYFKCSHDESEPFKELLISKKGVNHVGISDIPKYYNGPLKINKSKKEDLISILPLINEQFHSFYNSLETDECIRNIHPDLTDSEDE